MTIEMFLLRHHGFDLGKAEIECNRVNMIMLNIKVGDYFYETCHHDGAFCLKVDEIIDRDYGDVKFSYEAGGKRYTKVMNINNVKTFDEASEYVEGLGFKLCKRTKHDKRYF
jgi:hypothetical protein